jgi:hypothetical protein
MKKILEGFKKNRSEEMQDWVDKLKVVDQEGKQVKLAVVSANNHYVGFGPATVNLFRQMMGLALVNWQEQEDKVTHIKDNTSTIESEQRSISDYL